MHKFLRWFVIVGLGGLLAQASFAAGIAMITDASGRIEAEQDGAVLGVLAELEGGAKLRLGAGAVALKINAAHYLLGDANDALINLWHHLVHYPNATYLRTRVIEATYGHTEDGYTGARNLFNGYRAEGMLTKEPEYEVDFELMRGARFDLAGLMLYLLAHGYNGLWRENRSGEYNVPFGGYHQRRFKYPSQEEIVAVSELLRGRSTFFSTDFEVLIDLAPPGSVIYADPPYVGTFDDYTAGGFSNDDQRRLGAALERAARRGAHVFASNAYHPLIHEIYAWASIEDVSERWSVGSKGERRGKTPCVLIRSRA